MKNIAISFFLVSILFFSCNSKKQKDDTLEITFKKECNVNPRDILDISYVKLDTPDSCLIKNIGLVASVEQYLLILDTGNSSLYVFDKKGHFLKTVGKKGSGPGEYILLSNFFVDNKKNRLGLIDVSQKKILYYSISDFSFIAESKIPFDGSCCELLGDGSMVWDNKGYTDENINDSYFLVTDSLLSPLQAAVEKKFKSGYQIGDSKMIYKFQNRVFAYSPFMLDVYEIKSNGSEKAFTLSIEGHEAPPYSFLMKESNGGNSNYFQALENSEYVSFYTVKESEKCICVCYMSNNKKYIGFYDKKKKETYHYELQDLQEKLNIVGLNYFASGIAGEYCVAPLNPGELINLQEDGYELPKDLSELIKKTSEDDNPILLLVGFK